MGFSAAKILPCPPYMPLGTIEIREGFGPLELSRGFSTVCGGPPKGRAAETPGNLPPSEAKTPQKADSLHGAVAFFAGMC